MQTARILVVDDDLDDQVLLCDAIHQVQADSDCSIANNGMEALSKVETRPLFDIIFLDLNMPIMNGYETLRILKNDRRFQNIPVVVVSTSPTPSDIELCKQLGAHRYLTKPSTFNELVSGLKQILVTS